MRYGIGVNFIFLSLLVNMATRKFKMTCVCGFHYVSAVQFFIKDGQLIVGRDCVYLVHHDLAQGLEGGKWLINVC